MKGCCLILASLLLLGACDNTTTSPSDDLAYDSTITDPLEAEPDLSDYEADAGYLAAPLVELQGFLAIWRDLVRPFENTWVIEQLGPGLFAVTRTATLTGTLHVQWEDSTVTDKPFTCSGTKRSVVSRPVRHLPGTLQQISPTLIQTDGGIVAISRVEIVAASGTTLIDDPLRLMDFPEGLVHLDAREPVTVRVYGPPQDAIVVLRVPATLSNFSNFVMTWAGDHFEGEWHAPEYPGLRRVAIDVLSHATVYEPTAPYDGTAWIFPYVVR